MSRRAQIDTLHGRAKLLEQEIHALEAALGATQMGALHPGAAEPQPSAADFLAQNDMAQDDGLLDFVLQKVRQNAAGESLGEQARVEELIAGTVSGRKAAAEASRKAAAQHKVLIDEFGEGAVAAWKEEHGEAVKDQLGFPGRRF